MPKTWISFACLVISVVCLGRGFAARSVVANASEVQSAPTLTSISPTQTAKGQAPEKITLKGTGFVSGSKVVFNTTEVAAKIKSDTKIVLKNLSATLFQTDITYDVKVVAPNGQASNALKFTVGTGGGGTSQAASIRITSPESFVLNSASAGTGSTVQLSVEVLDKDGQVIGGAPVAYTSLNPDVASVGSTGLVSGLLAGAATIEISSGEAKTQADFTVNSVDSETAGIFGDGDIEVEPGTTNVFATDFEKHVVRVRRLGQTMSDFSGKSGTPGGADGSASAALFNAPLGVTVGKRVFLADTVNQSVRQVDSTTGEVKTLVTLNDVRASVGVSSWGPRDVTVDSNGDLYVTDAVNHVVWQAVIDDGSASVRVLAGAVGQAGSQDGNPGQARFNTPQRLTLESNILSVTENSALVRQIALPGGEVKSISSSSGRSAATDGNSLETGALQFTKPTAIDADEGESLYVVDGDSVKVLSRVRGRFSITDLAPRGTFKRPVAVAVADASVLVLDSQLGSIIRIGQAPPSISSVTPAQVQAGTPAQIVVKGRNFLANSQVRVGRNLVSDVTVVNSGELRFTLPPQEFGGTLTFTIFNRGGRAQGQIVVNGPTALPSISILAFPDERTVSAGKRATYTITVLRTNFSNPVTLSVSGLPVGATAEFSPNPLDSSPASLLTVTTSPTTPSGRFTLRVTAEGAGIRSVSDGIGLTIGGGGTGGVTLSATPSSQSVVQGLTAVFAVAINRNGFTGSIDLSATPAGGSVTGLTTNFTPNPTTLSASVLTVGTSSATPAGTYTLRIQGTASGTTISPVDVTVTVRRFAAPGSGDDSSVAQTPH